MKNEEHNELTATVERPALAKPPTWRDRIPPQKKIAIVGTAPDSCGLAPFNDPAWQIWVLSDAAETGIVPRWDVSFELHDWPFESDNPHRAWLRKPHGKAIVLNRERSEVPDGLALPADEITGAFGRYITNSVSWMIGMAILCRPEEIALYGVNMAQDGEYAHQRPSCEFFAGIALGAGIRLSIPQASDLLKCGSLYGIERNPMLVKMAVRRKELEARLANARALELQWTTERVMLEGMVKECVYWDMYGGASQ